MQPGAIFAAALPTGAPCADRQAEGTLPVQLPLRERLYRAHHSGLYWPFPYIDGLIMQVTHNIGRLQVRHLTRKGGRSNYTIRRLVRLFMAMSLNFSVMPLRLSTLLGISMAGFGFGLLSVVSRRCRVGHRKAGPR